jgi:hypothetical protein
VSSNDFADTTHAILVGIRRPAVTLDRRAPTHWPGPGISPDPWIKLALTLKHAKSSTRKWIFCARERGVGGFPDTCSFSGSKLVRFGYGEKYFEQVHTNSVICSLTGFGGDPLRGQLKSCEYAYETPVIKFGIIPLSTLTRDANQDVAAHNTNDMCESCNKGTFLNITDVNYRDYDINGQQNMCQSCEVGTYSDERAAQVCKGCPPGQFQPLTGMGVCNTHTVTSCGKGERYQPGNAKEDNIQKTACVACEPGKKRNQKGHVKMDCNSCESGKVALAVGLSQCTACGKGQYAASASAICVSCNAGTYHDQTGQATGPDCKTHTVTSCGKGERYQPGNAMEDNKQKTACVVCEPGKYLASKKHVKMECNRHTVKYCGKGKRHRPGSVKRNDAACVTCANGMYNDVTPSTSTSCKTCPGGKVATANHFECQCAKGTFSSGDECKLCSVNTYNDEEGANTCKGVCLYMCMCARIGEERVVGGGGVLHSPQGQ